MPKIPRDLSGRKLATLLSKYGYIINKQRGSHIRLTSNFKGIPHRITIPNHGSIKIGTLSYILRDIADYLKMDKEVFTDELFKEG